MGFHEVRRRAIACLRADAFDSVMRLAMSEKNLLATGDVSADDVVRMIVLCRGIQYTARRMTDNTTILKHEMKPVVDGERWFIRFFFVPQPTDMMMFISVHKSDHPHYWS